ncbi:MAG: hypothetical protein ACI8Y3_001339 [Paraglaciecola sp.]
MAKDLILGSRMIDKRKHIRFEFKGILANITLYPASSQETILLQGVVVDMSYSGIKIKLFSAIPANIGESKMEIHLTLPKSSLPIAIKGMIRYVNPQSEMGFKFAGDHAKQEIDDLLFECVKTPPTTTAHQGANIHYA